MNMKPIHDNYEITPTGEFIIVSIKKLLKHPKVKAQLELVRQIRERLIKNAN